MLRFDQMSKSWSVAWLAAAFVVISPAARSADEPRFEVTPMFGYHGGGQFKDPAKAVTDPTADTTVNLNSAGVAAVAINWRAAESGTQYELFYARQSTDTDETVPTKLKVEYLHVGGTTLVGDAEDRVTPFAVGGIGATRFSPGLSTMSKETRWSLNLGGGVRVPIAKHVRLRFEARGYLTWLGGNANLFCDGGCTLVAKSKTFFQYAALGGVSVSF